MLVLEAGDVNEHVGFCIPSLNIASASADERKVSISSPKISELPSLYCLVTLIMGRTGKLWQEPDRGSATSSAVRFASMPVRSDGSRSAAFTSSTVGLCG